MNPSTTDKKIQSIIGLMHKNLECSICLDLLKNPVSTKCDHPFCNFCIREFLKTKRSVPCPLCKSPVTKRSLRERPQLSKIVDDVQRLLGAFQHDTETLCSPTRLPQTAEYFPQTPDRLPGRESRGTKRKVNQSDRKNCRNIRQSKRRKSDAVISKKGDATTNIPTKSDQNDKGNSPMDKDETSNGPQNPEECGENSDKSHLEAADSLSAKGGEKENNDLLDYLEHGSCGAQMSDIEETRQHTKSRVHLSNTEKERLEPGSNSGSKGNPRTNNDGLGSGCRSKLNSRSHSGFGENWPSPRKGDNLFERLSGMSIENVDKTTNCDTNLARAPESNLLIDSSECEKQGIQAEEKEGGLFNTPEEVSTVQRTYSRKFKEEKDVKRKSKVKQWLKNIDPSGTDNDEEMRTTDRTERKMEVEEEGENDRQRNEIYSGDDFEDVDNDVEIVAPTLETEVEVIPVVTIPEKDESESTDHEKRSDIDKGLSHFNMNGCDVTEKRKKLDEYQSVKHRIFKSTRSDSHQTTERAVTQTKGKLMFKKIQPKKVVDLTEIHKGSSSTEGSSEIKGKSVVSKTLGGVRSKDRNIFDLDLNSSGQESDPYEFKSSQKTPVKQTNKKSKPGKMNKEGQIHVEIKKSVAKGSGKSILKKAQQTTITKMTEREGKGAEDVIEIMEEGDVLDKLKGVQKQGKIPGNKKGSPRLELTQKDFDDMEKLKDKISEAEDYDLITSTQEVHSQLEAESVIEGTCQGEGLRAGFSTVWQNLDRCSRKKLVSFHEDVILIGEDDTVPLSNKETAGKLTGMQKGKDNSGIKTMQINKENSYTFQRGKNNFNATQKGKDTSCMNAMRIDEENLYAPRKGKDNSNVIQERKDNSGASHELGQKNNCRDFSASDQVQKDSDCAGSDPDLEQASMLDTQGAGNDEDDINSSGTVDLDIDPDVADFEAPDLGIQPVEVIEKLNSQESEDPLPRSHASHVTQVTLGNPEVKKRKYGRGPLEHDACKTEKDKMEENLSLCTDKREVRDFKAPLVRERKSKKHVGKLGLTKTVIPETPVLEGEVLEVPETPIAIEKQDEHRINDKRSSDLRFESRELDTVMEAEVNSSSDRLPEDPTLTENAQLLESVGPGMYDSMKNKAKIMQTSGNGERQNGSRSDEPETRNDVVMPSYDNTESTLSVEDFKEAVSLDSKEKQIPVSKTKNKLSIVKKKSTQSSTTADLAKSEIVGGQESSSQSSTQGSVSLLQPQRVIHVSPSLDSISDSVSESCSDEIVQPSEEPKTKRPKRKCFSLKASPCQNENTDSFKQSLVSASVETVDETQSQREDGRLTEGEGHRKSDDSSIMKNCASQSTTNISGTKHNKLKRKSREKNETSRSGSSLEEKRSSAGSTKYGSPLRTRNEVIYRELKEGSKKSEPIQISLPPEKEKDECQGNEQIVVQETLDVKADFDENMDVSEDETNVIPETVESCVAMETENDEVYATKLETETKRGVDGTQEKKFGQGCEETEIGKEDGGTLTQINGTVEERNRDVKKAEKAVKDDENVICSSNANIDKTETVTDSERVSQDELLSTLLSSRTVRKLEKLERSRHDSPDDIFNMDSEYPGSFGSQAQNQEGMLDLMTLESESEAGSQSKEKTCDTLSQSASNIGAELLKAGKSSNAKEYGTDDESKMMDSVSCDVSEKDHNFSDSEISQQSPLKKRTSRTKRGLAKRLSGASSKNSLQSLSPCKSQTSEEARGSQYIKRKKHREASPTFDSSPHKGSQNTPSKSVSQRRNPSQREISEEKNPLLSNNISQKHSERKDNKTSSEDEPSHDDEVIVCEEREEVPTIPDSGLTQDERCNASQKSDVLFSNTVTAESPSSLAINDTETKSYQVYPVKSTLEETNEKVLLGDTLMRKRSHRLKERGQRRKEDMMKLLAKRRDQRVKSSLTDDHSEDGSSPSSSPLPDILGTSTQNESDDADEEDDPVLIKRSFSEDNDVMNQDEKDDKVMNEDEKDDNVMNEDEKDNDVINKDEKDDDVMNEDEEEDDDDISITQTPRNIDIARKKERNEEHADEKDKDDKVDDMKDDRSDSESSDLVLLSEKENDERSDEEDDFEEKSIMKRTTQLADDDNDGDDSAYDNVRRKNSCRNTVIKDIKDEVPDEERSETTEKLGNKRGNLDDFVDDQSDSDDDDSVITVKKKKTKMIDDSGEKKSDDGEDENFDDEKDDGNDNMKMKKRKPEFDDNLHEKSDNKRLQSDDIGYDDEDDDVIIVKKRKSQIIEDSESDVTSSQDMSSDRHMNLTSSSAFSSQSEPISTQNQAKMVENLERMKREIAKMEANLAAVQKKSLDLSRSNSSKSASFEEKKTVKEAADREVECCDDSKAQVEEEEKIAVYDSGDDSSDDLFLSPPPPTPPPSQGEGDVEQKMEVDLPESVKAADEFLQQFRGEDKTPSKTISPRDGKTSTPRSIYHSTPKTGKPISPFNLQTNGKIISPLMEPNKKSPLTFTSSQKHRSSGLVESKQKYPSPLLTKKGLSQKFSERVPLSPLVMNGSLPGHVQEVRTKKGFAATSLLLPQLKELQRLVQEFGCQFYSKFSAAVTHLIVKTDPQGSRVCERTLKFFQAVARGCWVLDYQYVVDCKTAGRLLPEEKFEIQGDTVTGDYHYGPRKSRRSKEKDLFAKFQFYIIGESKGLQPDDLRSLICDCGGTVVSRIDDFTDSRFPLIITCTDMDGDEEEESANRSSQEVKVINRLYRLNKVLTVSREWVLDSLTLYEVQPLDEYVLTSVKGIVIPKT